AGIVAGLAYAFNAHIFVRMGHMQAMHVEFLPFALLALHELMARPAWRWAWLLAAACALQSLTSNYLLVMTVIAMIAAAVVVPSAWIGAGAGRRWTLVAAAAAVCSLVLVPFLLPYYHARNAQGLVRSYDDVAMYAAHWQDYIYTAGRLHYAWWSHDVLEAQSPLFPGIAVLALAAYALAATATWREPRYRALVAIGVAGVALSFGPSLPGYRWLYDHVALLQGIRAVVRIGWLSLFALAALAGVGVWRLERRWPTHATAIAIIGSLLVSLEATRAPMDFRRFEGIPAIYTHVAALSNAVLVELPFPPPSSIQANGPYVLASTTHFQPMLNGYSGFTPASYYVHAAVAARLPAASAVQELGYLGATHLVVHGRAITPETVAQLEATGRVRLVAREGDDRLYAIVKDETR
ncbi:MAG: hypothetical protein ABI880_07675, partial [Acidobacteriota bacterium]